MNKIWPSSMIFDKRFYLLSFDYCFFPSVVFLQLSQSCKIYVQPQGKLCRIKYFLVCCCASLTLITVLHSSVLTVFPHYHTLCSTEFVFALAIGCHAMQDNPKHSSVLCPTSSHVWQIVSPHRLEESPRPAIAEPGPVDAYFLCLLSIVVISSDFFSIDITGIHSVRRTVD